MQLTPEQQKMAADHMQKAIQIARRYCRMRGITNPAVMDELESIALFQLCRLAYRYDATKGASFSTYLSVSLKWTLSLTLTRLIDSRFVTLETDPHEAEAPPISFAELIDGLSPLQQNILTRRLVNRETFREIGEARGEPGWKQEEAYRQGILRLKSTLK